MRNQDLILICCLVGEIFCSPRCRASSFAKQVFTHYGYHHSRIMVYRAWALAVDIVKGSFINNMKHCGTTTMTCKKGFLDGCGPVICLGGTHIKGPHPGQLLFVIRVNGNNDMFPIAYAVAEVEAFNTWMWFLELLGQDLNIGNSHGYVFMIDKQKGLINVVSTLFPSVEHRHYLKHLYSNFNIEHKGLALKLQMENIARSTTVPWYDVEMRKMLELSTKAHAWLADQSIKPISQHVTTAEGSQARKRMKKNAKRKHFIKDPFFHP
ncbi:unnamed protein product [Prunus armeniaca]